MDEKDIVHQIAPGEGITACCHKTPFELPKTDRITEKANDVNCRSYGWKQAVKEEEK